ncbi:MAG: site-specific integrase [Proteobacteria bacterium]|nr:site-specific integrase [Candidatus Enterousia onthequi]
MTNNHINFTEKNLLELPVPTDDKAAVYYDTGQAGLCVMITYGGTKTYYFYTKFLGVPKRVKIGRVGVTKLVDARMKARELRTEADKGNDPSQERNETLRDMTLKQFFNTQYFPRHVKVYTRPKSQAKAETMFRNYLGEFHNRKMISITRADMERMHAGLCDRISLYTANRTLALVKHMYNKAIEWGYPSRHGNPAVGIKMFRERSRDRFLLPDEIKRFFAALNEEANEVFKNYVLLSLYIGQRRQNMLSMRWSNVDLDLGHVLFPDSKNGDPQRIPLITQALDILKDMRQHATDDWVFSSNAGSKSGHFEDLHRPWYALLERAGIEDMRIHDLRRTFGSYQAITGASLHIIGKALGDKTTAATQVYSRLTMDPIRDSIQRGADKMLEFVDGR